jgi:hypothetical protein
MFLAAVACPCFDAEGECIFDGKIGMWPFVERVEAKRTSKNCERGTIETKVVPGVNNKIRYRGFMGKKVIPARKETWPARNQKILIQQDGASSHIDEDDPEFGAVGVPGVWNIRLMTQSPKSPDLNAFDNNYELRHMGKDTALCDRILPEVLVPSDDASELFDMM